MHYLNITGYGARRRRCKGVVSWFLHKYLPRHHIAIEVLHRGLKREESYGYCSVSEEISMNMLDRNLLIRVDYLCPG